MHECLFHLRQWPLVSKGPTLPFRLVNLVEVAASKPRPTISVHISSFTCLVQLCNAHLGQAIDFFTTKGVNQ